MGVSLMYIIAGKFKNRILVTPKGLTTRPTSSRLREAVFNICQNEIEGASFLDLFAGSGAMGIEALSRGAKKAIFIDTSRESIRCICQNVDHFGLKTNSEVIQGDVYQHLKRLIQAGQTFDLIYADPPYELMTLKGQKESQLYASLILQLIDENALLSPTGSLFIEEASSTSLPQEFQNLQVKSIRKMGRSSLYQFQKFID
jgi:16S rRNA (guanine966-N2)-methyltransferase